MAVSSSTFITIFCIFHVSQKSIGGTEVERKVRPGERITLFCDCRMRDGDDLQLSYIIWSRHYSHVSQPPFRISSMGNNSPSHLSLIRNPLNNTYDLVVENITKYDLGVYYCGYTWKKGKQKEKHGTMFTRLTFEEPSKPPPPDCQTVWSLLAILCPISALLSALTSSACVLILSKKTKSNKEVADITPQRTVEEAESANYAAINFVAHQHNRTPRPKSTLNTDSCTYSEVKRSPV
ncbi:uncharacterized protein LOC134066509 [Sardina pilchardus]|uniref:uncharacterized protein LOC134066509 n=1 Tax=Sardina pilchardus TaxID=27697 RepID=UPI002E13249E